MGTEKEYFKEVRSGFNLIYEENNINNKNNIVGFYIFKNNSSDLVHITWRTILNIYKFEVLVKFSQTKNYVLLVVFCVLIELFFESSNSTPNIKKGEDLLFSNMLKIHFKILNPCSGSVWLHCLAVKWSKLALHIQESERPSTDTSLRTALS